LSISRNTNTSHVAKASVVLINFVRKTSNEQHDEFCDIY